MKEIVGNVLDIDEVDGLPVIGKFVTTNGIIKKSGEAVMGAGVALAFKEKYPGIQYSLAERLQKFGNRVNCIARTISPLGHEIKIMSYPTKHHWRDPSSMDLIISSAKTVSLIVAMDETEDNKGCYLLPRPGCSNGGLDWEEVKKAIEHILPENVYIINLEE